MRMALLTNTKGEPKLFSRFVTGEWKTKEGINVFKWMEQCMKTHT